jgi:SAM-dependent methyltransferase
LNDLPETSRVTFSPTLRVLDIGCGSKKLPGAVGVDLFEMPGVDVVHDLNRRPWPFGDSTFDCVVFRHALNNLRHVEGALAEAHRLCVHGGTIEILAPHGLSDNYFTDPTHRFPLDWSTLERFCAPGPGGTPALFELRGRRLSFVQARHYPDERRRPNPLKWVGLEQAVNLVPGLYERRFAAALRPNEIFVSLRVLKTGHRGLDRFVLTFFTEAAGRALAGVAGRLAARGVEPEVICPRDPVTSQLVKEIEYSPVRMFTRPFALRAYYGELRARLDAVISQAGDSGTVHVFSPEEGAPMEILQAIGRRWKETRNIHFHCVQHGYLPLEPAPYQTLRRAYNRIGQALTGYPLVGYGTGGSRADTYLVYSQHERSFLASIGVRPERVFVVPRLIKQDLFTGRKDRKAPEFAFMLALQPFDGPNLSASGAEIFAYLRRVTKRLGELGGTPVLIRPHPGTDRDAVVRGMTRDLDSPVVIDNDPDVVASLCRARTTVSFFSSIMVDAALMGNGVIGLLHPKMRLRNIYCDNYYTLEELESVSPSALAERLSRCKPLPIDADEGELSRFDRLIFGGSR